MSSAERIPISQRVRWREFRQVGLPTLVFGAGVLSALVLWDRAVAPPSLLAEAERVQVDVRAAHAGTLAALAVQPLAAVRAGEVLGHVLPADPGVLQATLSLIGAEIELQRATLEPVQLARRATLEQERLRLEWMRERVALASLRAALLDADATVARLEPLHRGRLVAEDEYTRACVRRDGLQEQIADQEALVGRLFPLLDPPADPSLLLASVSPATAMDAALRVQEQRLRLAEAQLGPQALRAPIDGRIVLLHRRQGEHLLAGDPIVTVAAERSERLVGYLRQPLALEPRVGQRAEVRTRSLPRRTGLSVVQGVSASLEPLSPTFLAAINRPGAADLGLCVHLSIPRELSLHPGEQVEVVLLDAP